MLWVRKGLAVKSMLISLCFPYYLPQRSWGKVMFLQASVILLTGGEGVPHPPDYVPPRLSTPGLCTHWPMYPLDYVPPGLHTPQDYVPPWDYVPPGLHTPRLHTPPDYVLPRICTPQEYVPPLVDGLCAGGTHPTGMHSCLKVKWFPGIGSVMM